MNLLALDTSTEFCSAALWLDGRVTSDGCLAGQRHSQLLLGMIDGLLVQAGVRVGDLDAIVYGEGPGSFTGLRIACGMAQGLAFGADKPVIGIGTLLALAEAGGATHAVCCLDARMRQVYHAAYRRCPQGWETLSAPGLYSPADVPALPDGVWIGCGSGFRVDTAALTQALGRPLLRIEAELLPHAREMVRLAAAQWQRGQRGQSPEQALPVYLRDKVALTIEEQR